MTAHMCMSMLPVMSAAAKPEPHAARVSRLNAEAAVAAREELEEERRQRALCPEEYAEVRQAELAVGSCRSRRSYLRATDRVTAARARLAAALLERVGS